MLQHAKSRVYFNPNWEPSYYYAMLKPLVLLYDTVVLWSPRGTYLDEYAGGASEFLDFLRKTRAQATSEIIPVGRAEWMMGEISSSGPSLDAAELAFLTELRASSILGTSRNGKTGLVPSADRDTAYVYSRKVWDTNPDLVRSIAEQVGPFFDHQFMESVYQVADEQNFSLPQAITNAFYQDVQAMAYLGCMNPVTKPELMAGFTCLNIAGEPYSRDGIDSREIERFPGYGNNIEPKELQDFVADLFFANNLSWDEIHQLKWKEGTQIRRYIRDVVTARTPDVGLTLPDQAVSDIKSLVGKIVEEKRWWSSVGTAAVTGVFSATLDHDIGNAVKMAALSGATTYAALSRLEDKTKKQEEKVKIKLLQGGTNIDSYLLKKFARKANREFIVNTPFLHKSLVV